MNKYEARWWCNSAWQDTIMELIAESEEQVRRLVDEISLPEYRYKRFSEPKEDSLIIKKVEIIELPYVLREY